MSLSCRDVAIARSLTFLCRSCIDWASFLLLDVRRSPLECLSRFPLTFCDAIQIGNEEIEAIPIGNRVFLGLFQAVSVRSCGLAIVSLASIAPALQVLYLSMFQVAAYPIAVAVR